MSSTLRAFSRTSCKLPPRKCLNNLFLSEDKAKQRQETLYSHNVQIDGTDRSYVNNLAFHLKELEKLEQPKSQGGGRKGTIRLEQKFKRTMQMITIKSWFFERHFNMLFAGKWESRHIAVDVVQVQWSLGIIMDSPKGVT